MQLLSILWVSSLWAVLLVSLLFHALYVGQSAAYSVQHEESQALIEAFMRVACVRYQSDALVRERVRREKQLSLHCDVNHRVSGGVLSADIIYQLQPRGIQITVLMRRGMALVATEKHLFVHRAFAIAQKS